MGSSSRIACRSSSSLSHAPTSSDACLQWHRYRPLSRGRVVCCMQPDALAEAGEWLARAQEDLAAAERLLQTPPPLLAVAAYHHSSGGRPLALAMGRNAAPLEVAETLQQRTVLVVECPFYAADVGGQARAHPRAACCADRHAGALQCRLQRHRPGRFP